jgi:hypothetical protein
MSIAYYHIIKRKRRKKIRRSPVSSSGASNAAKWPPRSNSDQCTIVYLSSARRRTGRTRSCGKTATPAAWDTASVCPVAMRTRSRDELTSRLSREPIEHYVGEQAVDLDRTSRIDPFDELLCDPGQLPDR